MAVTPRPRALYRRIADTLRSEINDGSLGPEDRLPTEAEIARRWETSRSTAVQGLRVLVNEGLIVADRPRGYFVRRRQPMVYRPQSEFQKRPLSPEMDIFLTQMSQEGRTADQKIEVSVVAPPPTVRERLSLADGDLTVVRRRTRFIDEIPYNTNDSYFPYSAVQGSVIMSPEDIARGANVVLAELGWEQVRAIDEYEVRMPTPEEVDRLQIASGTPVLVHVCTGYTAAGRPARSVINILPGDRHVVTYERLRTPTGSSPTIRRAAEEDLNTVVDLWNHAGQWLRSKGIDQWQYPPREERIRQNIQNGECWIVDDDTVPVATITIDSYTDRDFWTAKEAEEEALYVHRMAVRRDASGKELGSALLDWASRRAAASGAAWLRLDAWRDNQALHRYYTERGFTHVRTVARDGRQSGALFQRAAGTLTGRGPRLAEAPDPNPANTSPDGGEMLTP